MPVKTIIQWRRDTAAGWNNADPVLAASEAGHETDTNKFKLGDGATTWSALPYVTTGAGGGTVAAETFDAFLLSGM